MRLSYLRYVLKTAADPCRLLNQKSEELRLSSEFRALLEPLRARPVASARGRLWQIG